MNVKNGFLTGLIWNLYLERNSSSVEILYLLIYDSVEF